MSILSRMISPFMAKAVEGEYRPGPYYLPYEGGWLSAEAGQFLNWWQMGHNVSGPGINAMVEACVSAYSQTVSMCPGDHWRTKRNGGRERVTNSDISRILKEPNDYQTISDFLLNLVRSLYVDGNAYALALRNNRYEVDSIHLMHPHMSCPQVYGGEIFYSLGGNEIISQRLTGASNNQLTVPARDVLHIKLHTSLAGHGLIGESPLKQAVAMDLATSQAMTAQNLAFYTNQARPSSVLATDEKLTPEQVKQIHELWNSQSRGMNQGKTPILTMGFKPIPLSVSPQDSQMAEIMKMSDQRIALAFRIPMSILGISSGPGSGSGTSTELLMHSWIAQGLGFALNQVEEGFGKFFGLKGQPEEYVEFSTAVLLRSSMKDRIAALAQGVQGGIYAPNEARAVEELPAVEFGDEPRVQQQVVPLSAAAKIPALPGPASSPGPGPSAPVKPDLPAADPGSKKDFDFDRDNIRRRFRSARNAVGSLPV